MIGPHPPFQTLYLADFLAQVLLVSRIAWLPQCSLESKRIPWSCDVRCCEISDEGDEYLQVGLT